MNRLRGPFNASSPALAAGLAALSDVDFTNKVRNYTAKWLDWTKGQLIQLGLEVPSQVGNFLLVGFPATGKSAKATDEFLKSRSLIVRRMDGYGLSNYLRITVGREDEMRALVSALTEFHG
jgi:histidinol-phosphate aminotransferase